jgi:hypothetical protein
MTTGDWERVLKFLDDDYGLKGLTFDYLVLKDLQDLRKESGRPRSRSDDREIVGRTGLCRSKLRSRG